jgi:uncharacterized protein (TIGR02246 family)
MERLALILIGTVFWMTASSWAEETTRTSSSEAAIRQSAPSYVKAFNAHDSKALASQWSPDAVYVDRATGDEVIGRDAISAQFDALFKSQPDLKLDVSVESIRFLSPNVAVEQGTSKFLSPKREPEEVDYTAVYVQREGKWLLDRVTDDAPAAATSHYEQLKTLEFLVGKWVDQDEQARIETECSWAKNNNFLVRSFTVAVGDKIDMSGMQVIGWDAASKSIRSWTFDSNGGFAEGTWSGRGKSWFIHNKGILADGQKMTMVNVVKPVDDKSFTWRTIDRTVGGELLPNIAEVTIVRQ